MALAIVSNVVPQAWAAGGAEHRSMRRLAAELESRLGQNQVELRAGQASLKIGAVGQRETEEPVVFRSRIPATALLDAMNRERTARGLEPLRLSRRLSLAAGDRLAEMLEQHYFAHVSPDGRVPFEVIEERGYDFRKAGENLASGFASAKLVVAAWMRSPGHRDNLLSPSFEAVGIAVSDAAPTDEMRGHTFVALYGAE